MPQTQTITIPKLRFPGFSGGWEERRLDSMISFQAGYAFSSNDMTSENDNYQLIKMSNVFMNELRLDRNPSYRSTIEGTQKFALLKKGDSVLTLTGTVGKRDYGYSVQIDKDNSYLLNQRLVRLREIDGISNNDFIAFLISYERFLYYFFSESKGGTGNQTNVSIEDVKSICLNFPTLPEQTKIASFLTQVDKKIDNLTKLKSERESYKKGVMQQVFLQQIRFKDEKGGDFAEWEERILGSLCDITTGKLDANAMVIGGQYRFYTCAKDYFEIDEYAFDTEALLISGNGANVGYIHYYKGKFNAYQRTYVLDLFKENIIYTKYFLDHFLSKRIGLEKKDGNTPYIVLSTLSEMNIFLPSPSEQQKIANFLSQLDEKIGELDKQIEQAKQRKKGLLQGLFI